MKMKEMIVTNHGAGMQEALLVTEKLGAGNGLNGKEKLRLRLLAEELFGMVRSIVGDLEACYWVESEGRTFKIHLQSEIDLTRETRKKIIAVSTQGENAAAKGFMGKLRDMIAAAMLPKEEGPSLLQLGLMSMGSPNSMRVGIGDFDWSMNRYRAELDHNRSGDEKAADAWDELEKSIVASIADEVRVHISGSAVEITIVKTF